MNRNIEEKRNKLIDLFGNNTKAFLKIYNGFKSNDLHRRVYDKSIVNPNYAISYINYLLTINCEKIDAKRVLDLGAGLGESIVYLSNNSTQRNSSVVKFSDFSYNALSISPFENAEAQNNFRKNGISDMARSFCGDYHDKNVFRFFKNMDLIYCFESIIYSYNTKKVLSNVAASLKKNGYFLVVDIFISDTIDTEKTELLQSLKYDIVDILHFFSLYKEKDFIILANRFNLLLIERLDFTDIQRLEIDEHPFLSAISSLSMSNNLKHKYSDLVKSYKKLNYLFENNILKYMLYIFKKAED